MSTMQVLLVNPSIYDFTAYDFWLRPYGMLRVAGRMGHCCRFSFFDYLISRRRDPWGRGRFDSREVPKPACLSDIPRRFRRFGRPRGEFREYLQSRSFDAILIQTTMTYWYPGVQEVIEDARALQPSATFKREPLSHNKTAFAIRRLGEDYVTDLKPLTRFLNRQL
jgi:hypothetical protein